MVNVENSLAKLSHVFQNILLSLQGMGSWLLLLLFYVHGKHLRSCRDCSVSLTTLFLGKLGPPKQLTSTLCTYFRL